jgi:hypothetical protein
MAPSRDHQQPVEIIEKYLRAALLIREMLTLCSLNPALHAISVHSSKQLLDGGFETERVIPKRLARHKRTVRTGLPSKWPDLDILPPVLPALSSHPFCKLRGPASLLQQWFAMVCERQRD